MRDNKLGIKAEVTLLPSARGPRIIRACRYMPHIVIGDPNQRKAIVDPRKGIMEDYLGVRFTDGPETLEVGVSACVKLELMYLIPNEDEGLAPGLTFTLREGGTIVGFGRILG